MQLCWVAASSSSSSKTWILGTQAEGHAVGRAGSTWQPQCSASATCIQGQGDGTHTRHHNVLCSSIIQPVKEGWQQQQQMRPTCSPRHWQACIKVYRGNSRIGVHCL